MSEHSPTSSSLSSSDATHCPKCGARATVFLTDAACTQCPWQGSASNLVSSSEAPTCAKLWNAMPDMVCHLAAGHRGDCEFIDPAKVERARTGSPASLAGTPEQTDVPECCGVVFAVVSGIDVTCDAPKGHDRSHRAVVGSLPIYSPILPRSASPASSDVLTEPTRCVECGATDTALERGADGQMRCVRRSRPRAAPVPPSSSIAVPTTARRTSAPAQLTDSSCEIERCGERQGVDIGWPSEPCEEPKGHAGLHRFVTRHANGRLSETFWGAQISGTQPIAEPTCARCGKPENEHHGAELWCHPESFTDAPQDRYSRFGTAQHTTTLATLARKVVQTSRESGATDAEEPFPNREPRPPKVNPDPRARDRA